MRGCTRMRMTGGNGGPALAVPGDSNTAGLCPLSGVDRIPWVQRENDANDRARRGRELSVREGLTRINVDWSGSWQAARPGNWLGRSPATKAGLGC
jgi:hypothetical protein